MPGNVDEAVFLHGGCSGSGFVKVVGGVAVLGYEGIAFSGLHVLGGHFFHQGFRKSVRGDQPSSLRALPASPSKVSTSAGRKLCGSIGHHSITALIGGLLFNANSLPFQMDVKASRSHGNNSQRCIARLWRSHNP